ncbi:MAG: hypothetical protein COA42_13815 [Alteromonadaceae bacterium]|nr:MAG: hypothetical protein COA42_13815 [Alteromonadaceae bacterium]
MGILKKPTSLLNTTVCSDSIYAELINYSEETIMANPLTLIMPVLPDTKLLTIVELLAKSQPAIDAALESIGTVHFARFSLLDRSKPNLQPDLLEINKPSSTLMIGVITVYDGDFNPYISDFVAQLGDVFNALLAVVVDGSTITPVQDNIAKFQDFVTTNDASQHKPNENLFSAYPQTVQQILAAFPPQ